MAVSLPLLAGPTYLLRHERASHVSGRHFAPRSASACGEFTADVLL